MMKETEEIIHANIDFLPLKSYANIVEGNALRMDWEEVVAKDELNYIMGNPPFVGARLMSANQRKDIIGVFGEKYKNVGNLDYVTGWFKKSFEYIKNTNIKLAFVSTSSIAEGEMVGYLWKDLLNEDLEIIFGYTPFKWASEASKIANVHVVIIGFQHGKFSDKKYIFDENRIDIVNNINPYIKDAPNIFIQRIRKPLCDVPKLHKGCQPTDGGNLIIEEDELEDFIKKEPKSEKYIKKLIGAKEFLNNKDRYCLWLVDVLPNELRSMPLVMDRIRKTRDMRLNAKDKGTQKLAETPHLFRETYNYNEYMVIPKFHSNSRKYIPIGFYGKDTISTDLNYISETDSTYNFGILESNVHMAWTKVVCGRMGKAIRYSVGIVYNTFPWPSHGQVKAKNKNKK